MRYSASKNSVMLKTGLRVVQGHWKWRRSTDHIRLSVVRHCKYSSIWYRFWVIWRRVISWPWNLDQRSLNVIQNGTIRKLGYGFLFTFYSNYGSILHQFRDKTRYWSKIVICSYPFAFDAPVRGGPRRSIAIPYGMEKPKWWCYPMVENFED